MRFKVYTSYEGDCGEQIYENFFVTANSKDEAWAKVEPPFDSTITLWDVQEVKE